MNKERNICHERVTGATYEKLFSSGDNLPQNNIDTVIPGLSEAVSSANGGYIEGSGDVSDMQMNNGEMTGNYVPIDSEGNEGEMQGFSIRTTDSYNTLSDAEKSSYTVFEGADGQKYYASVGQPYVSDYTASNGTENINSAVMVSDGQKYYTSSSRLVLSDLDAQPKHVPNPEPQRRNNSFNKSKRK